MDSGLVMTDWLTGNKHSNTLDALRGRRIFLSSCFVPFIMLFDVVDVWIGDWWVGGLML